MINKDESNCGDSSISAKITSLTFIQNIISRMAGNSLKIKAFFIGFLGVFITIIQLTGMTVLSYIIPTIITICACYLDSYYLTQERIFRHVYNEKAAKKPNTDTNFFDIKEEIKNSKNRESVINTIKSPAIMPFYFVSLLFIFLIWSINA